MNEKPLISPSSISSFPNSREFQTNFEKLHLKDTPSDLLPDLLKNNFLENPALLLVKDVYDIDDIWSRLKSAYGDTKIMLSKKVAELQNLEDLWKKKDPEKLAEGLIKINNLMRDLMIMAENHSIEANLYHGDAINTIHSLMGQSRFRRWMSIVCDNKIPDGAKHWDRLLQFLEKELKICQQEMIWSAKASKKQPSKPQDGKRKPDSAAHHASDEGMICSICGANDHAQTPGPSGIKLVQYYVCQKFVEMNCKERFTILKNKNLCHQCLFPGADCTKGKHKEGRCQRDFTCKHSSHDRFQRKPSICWSVTNIKTLLKTKLFLTTTSVDSFCVTTK